MATIEIRVVRHNATLGRVIRRLHAMGCIVARTDNTARHTTIEARSPIGTKTGTVTALQACEGVLSVRTR